MINSTSESVWKGINLSWLTGPIFDKELRISSRRKRNYALRTAYLALLLLVLMLIWGERIGSRSNNIVYQASRLSQVGLTITGTVVTIQFYLALIISVVMLSNSISDEVYSRTLGVLMSTPISMVQVVVGKMLSKLLQVTLLLCLTLPILGIIRVFGGVPWDFLLKSFIITLTAVIFAGILTLNLSIHQKHAYVVIIRAILGLILLFIVAPLFAGWIAIEHYGIKDITVFRFIMVTNPLFYMQALLGELFSPRGMPFKTNYMWIWHCLFMLGCSAVLFIRAIAVVRKKALLQACGQMDQSGQTKRILKSKKSKGIRRVKGPPILWKELRQSTLKISPIRKFIAFLLITASLLGSYYIFEKENFLEEEGCHIMYTMILSILSLFLTATYSATTITSEKSSQTWPALLCTLVSDWQIIWAKVLGTLRRSAPFWSLLILHVIIFSGLWKRYVHPATLPLYIIIITSVAFFVTCSGIFFSSLFKHSTSAVVANLIFVAILWGGIPFLAAIIGEITHTGDDLVELVIMVNPFYYLGEIMNDTAGLRDAGKPFSKLIYSWEIGDDMSFVETIILIGGVGSVYVASGLAFLGMTKKRLRKKIV